jgi:hypothetical protein
MFWMSPPAIERDGDSGIDRRTFIGWERYEINGDLNDRNPNCGRLRPLHV